MLQQLKTIPGLVVRYWTSDGSKSQLDFLVQSVGRIIPVEVKAEENLKAKSLRIYCAKFAPEIAIRTSMSDFRKEEWLTNVPLYAIGSYFEH